MSARCFHCGLPVGATPVTAEIEGESRAFCCQGCRAVCEAIHAAGLQGFYKRTSEGELLAPPPEPPADLGLYDLDVVQESYTDVSCDQREINLLVEGIHCAACVWLIEKGLETLPGVEEARVNLTGRRLRLRWDNGRLALSRILARLASLGYAATPFDPASAESSLAREQRALLLRLAWAGFAMMNLLWISIALYSGAEQGEFRSLFHWLGWLLATPTLIYSGAPFFRGAWAGLRHAQLGMDLPIALGVSITYLHSFWATLGGTGAVYWDTVVNFLFVILLGRYLEGRSRRRALGATERLLDLQPRVATRIEPDGEEQVVAVRALHPGDQVRVRPGERIAIDGEVLAGESQVDESMLSGESRPVHKGVGSQVAAGTLNGAGVLRVRVSAVLRESRLGRIIELVEQAQASRAPIARLADRIVPWFVAATLGLALLTALLWWGRDPDTALLAATAVLIVTCPCALGIAAPMAVAVAAGQGASRGILVKESAVLERLCAIEHLVFDKTGTLTEGRPVVVGWRVAEGEWRETENPVAQDDALRALLRHVLALEQLSEHPAARALVRWGASLGIDATGLEASQVEVVPGFGIRGEVAGRALVIGSARWLERCGIAPLAETSAPRADLQCALDGQARLALRLEDRLRPGAIELVGALREQGLRLTLLSGDRTDQVQRIAAALGGMEVMAEVVPEQKEAMIRSLREQGQRVAMVGDGINDAPALARAEVSIAVGSGTDVAIECADLVLIGGEPRRLLDALVLSRETLAVIRQNLGISLVYNLILVPLAMAGLVTPLLAAIAMPLSSLAVIANSARIGGRLAAARH